MSDEHQTDLQSNNHLKDAYQQLCDSYHNIDDFRAKLLGFLPLATGTGIFVLLDRLLVKGTDVQLLPNETKGFLVAIGIFGILITSGLFFYEIYGIRKCAALIKAGQRMEDLLHLDGQFKKRPQNVLYLINEPFAAGVIYPAVLAAWTFLAFVFGRSQEAAWIAASVVFGVGFIGIILYDRWLRKDWDTANTPAEQIIGKWKLADDTPDVSSEFFKDGTYVGRHALLIPMRRVTYTLINDGRRIRLISPNATEEFDLTIDTATMTWQADSDTLIKWVKIKRT